MPYARQYYFRRLQVENGLSNNTVFCSVQDKAGFMWFGTRDGLDRFDGYTFKVFRNDPQDTGSIGNSYIHSLFADREGTLWVGTRKGLFSYDAVGGNFRLLKISTGKDVREIKEDKDGNLWLIFGLSLGKYNIRTGQYSAYPAFANSTSVCVMEDGSVWVASTAGLISRYNPSTDGFTNYDLFVMSGQVASKWIEKIYEGEDGTLLIGTASQGLKIFDRQTAGYRDVLTYNADNTGMYVRDIVKSGKGEYWIATESGIYIYNQQSGAAVNLQKDYNNTYSISDNAIYTLCRDREGGIWAGTYFGGLSYHPHEYSYFEKFFPGYGSRALKGNAIREICEDKYGDLWIGTEDAGLNKLDRGAGLFSHFQPTGKKGDIAYSNIHGLLAVGDRLWIGTFERGLDIMDIPSGKVIKHYSAGTGPGRLGSNFIITIYRLRSGRVFIGSGAGLYEYDVRSDGFNNIAAVAGTDFVYSLGEDHTGSLWAGTENNGVYRYDPRTGTCENYRYSPTDKNTVGSGKINGIFEDSRGQLWFATEGGGLSMLDRKRRTFRRYTAAGGLPSDFVFRTLEDAGHNLWVSTSKGLACLDAVTGKVKTYSKEDGLLSDQFNYNSAYEDAQGSMYFGSVKGLISFNPGTFRDNTFIPPLYITGFQVHNAEFSPGRSILYTNRLTLKYDQSSFSIDFAALSFTAPEKTSYVYIMEGLDKDWTYLKANRKAYFTELPPGNYVFKVKASTNGLVYGREASLVIRILPPFWLSRVAYFLYLVLASLAVWWLVRNYHRWHEEKHRRVVYQAKIEFFTNVTHEIRTPLTLIKGPVEDLMNDYGDVPGIQKKLSMIGRNADRLIALTNELLDFRKTESAGFSLRFTQTDITALIKDVYNELAPAAALKGLVYTLDLPPASLVVSADGEACRKILINLFSNAVKYAKGRVRATLKLPGEDAPNFVFTISNDGFIIPVEMKERIFEPFFRMQETSDQKGTGIGLAIARSLASLHKGTLELQQPDGEYNTFVLRLPFTQ